MTYVAIPWTIFNKVPGKQPNTPGPASNNTCWHLCVKWCFNNSSASLQYRTSSAYVAAQGCSVFIPTWWADMSVAVPSLAEVSVARWTHAVIPGAPEDATACGTEGWSLALVGLLGLVPPVRREGWRSVRPIQRDTGAVEKEEAASTRLVELNTEETCWNFIIGDLTSDWAQYRTLVCRTLLSAQTCFTAWNKKSD